VSGQQEVALNVAQVMLQGFTSITASSAKPARRRSAISRPQLARCAAGLSRAHRFLRQRVMEAVEHIERDSARFPRRHGWQHIKLHYIGLLTYHKQPECAETFFNSVCCKICTAPIPQQVHFRAARGIDRAHRRRSAVLSLLLSGQYGLRPTLARMLQDIGLRRPFADLRATWLRAARVAQDTARPMHLEANHQIQILSSLFYRNKGAYLVGRMINGNQDYPFVIPVLHDRRESVPGRGAAGASAARYFLQHQSRLFPGGHGSALGLRGVLHGLLPVQAEMGDLHAARPAKARQEPVLARLPPSPAPFQRRLIVAPGIPALGDVGVHPAFLSLTCSR